MQSKHSSDKFFAVTQRVEDVADCYFYHTVELPGYGVTDGDWDFAPWSRRLPGEGGVCRITRSGDRSCQRFCHVRDEKAWRLKNSYWFSHAIQHSKARVYHGDVYNLPSSLGKFDVAVMASVLLHCRDPLRIVEQCGEKATSLVITDMLRPALEGAPICRLARTSQNFLWHTWWHFSTQFFTQFLAVSGFRTSQILTHQQYHRGRAHTLFTLVGRR
jgi:hypothetical protein